MLPIKKLKTNIYMQTLLKDGMNFLLVHDESFYFNSVCTVKYQPNVTIFLLRDIIGYFIYLVKFSFV